MSVGEGPSPNLSFLGSKTLVSWFTMLYLTVCLDLSEDSVVLKSQKGLSGQSKKTN